MDFNTLNSLVAPIHKGTYVRIVYETTPPLTAAAKKSGWTITKTTAETGRFACYSHLKTVKERRAESTYVTPAKPWYHEVVPYKIVQHNTKNSMYLAYVHDKNSAHVHTTYRAVNTETGEFVETHNSEDIKNLNIVQNSYWYSGYMTEMKTINIENVMSINNKDRV